MNKFFIAIVLTLGIAVSGWSQAVSTFYEGGSHFAYGLAFSPEWILGKSITARANFDIYMLNTINTAPSYGTIFAAAVSFEPRFYFKQNNYSELFLSLPVVFGRSDIPYNER
jgi:hypothetical protein